MHRAAGEWRDAGDAQNRLSIDNIKTQAYNPPCLMFLETHGGVK
jgi:hypothetical protein